LVSLNSTTLPKEPNPTLMAPPTPVSVLGACATAKAPCNGSTVPATRALGAATALSGRVDSPTPRATSTKESGRVTCATALANSPVSVGLSSQGSGKTMSRTGMAKRSGPIKRATTAIIREE
jgi:hypothetical protein